MKRLIIYKTLGLVGLIFTLACQDIIDEPAPKGVLAEGLNSTSITDGLVVAAYHGLSSHVGLQDPDRRAFSGPSNNWVMDVRSDDAYTGGEGASSLEYNGLPGLERARVFPADEDGDGLHIPLNKWKNNLIAIARTNAAIQAIKSLEGEDYPKEVRIGEMKLLRAHFHFDLKRNFKLIPYITEDDVASQVSNTQYTEEQIWEFIKEDLMEAFNTLPLEHVGESGRVNKYTAAAYLSKVHIQLNEWNNAIEMADFVINGPYSLLEEYEDLSTIEFENGLETVFAFQFSRGNVELDGAFFPNHNWASLLNAPRGAYGTGDGFYLGSQNLANAYRTGSDGLPLFDSFNNEVVTDASYSGNLDPRIDFTLGRIGVPWKDNGVYDQTWIRSPTFFPNGFGSKKQVVSASSPAINPPGVFPWAASGLNYQYIRFAEVLLWKAEALIEIGSLDEARILINRVRSRAKSSTYVKSADGVADAANYLINTYDQPFPNQEFARQAVRFERRIELAMEGHRYYDLVRWGVVKSTLDNFYAEEVNRAPHLEGENLTFPAGKEYLPIPQEEIDLAPSLYSQDPAY